MNGRFATFDTSKDGSPSKVSVRVRSGVSADERRTLARRLDAVPWELLEAAYGPAVAVPVHLYAAAYGEADTRAAAWWELWGNVHHQGTVYEATVHAVPFVAAVAADKTHPDRVQAVSFLRELAVGSGQHAAAVRDAVRPAVAALLAGSRNEPALVQQALVWLLSSFPSDIAEHPDLVGLIPLSLRDGWSEVLERVRTRHEDREYDEDDDASFDRQQEFEQWALAGWVEL